MSLMTNQPLFSNHFFPWARTGEPYPQEGLTKQNRGNDAVFLNLLIKKEDLSFSTGFIYSGLGAGITNS